MNQIKSPMTGSVWKVLVLIGDVVVAGQELVILESMKMEIPVTAERGGTVHEIWCQEGDLVEEAQTLVVLA